MSPSPTLTAATARCRADSFNHHQHLTGFHLTHGGSDAGSSQARGECGGAARRYARYTPPTAVNFIAYMQDSILRVVPGTQRDYTDIEGAGSGGPADRGEDYLYGMFMEKPEGDRISVRARPHPREACVPIKKGQVVCFHSNLLHCGMLNDSPTERRYYLSIFCASPAPALPCALRPAPFALLHSSLMAVGCLQMLVYITSARARATWASRWILCGAHRLAAPSTPCSTGRSSSRTGRPSRSLASKPSCRGRQLRPQTPSICWSGLGLGRINSGSSSV